MMLSAGYPEPALSMVSAYCPWSPMYRAVNTTPASASWESADRGVYFSIQVPTVCVARRMWWANGSTVSASYNVDAGIYRDAGNKPGTKLITTGSTAQGTASQVQFADITDTTLTPGRFWIVMTCSSTSATFFRTQLMGADMDELWRFDEASIGPGSLPVTATPAESSIQNLWLFGFSTTTIT